MSEQTKPECGHTTLMPSCGACYVFPWERKWGWTTTTRLRSAGETPAPQEPSELETQEPASPSVCATNSLMPACLDCGLPYASFPLDVVLPRPQWLAIHPNENGLLCAACIVARAAKVPGVTCVHAILEIAPHLPLSLPTPEVQS